MAGLSGRQNVCVWFQQQTNNRQTNKVFLCLEHHDFSVKMCCLKKVSVTSVMELELEPVCGKKQQKKFPTSYWFVEYGTSEDSKWYKIDPGWSRESLGLIYNQLGIIQVLQRSPIQETNNWSETLFFCFLQKTGSIKECISSLIWKMSQNYVRFAFFLKKSLLSKIQQDFK